MNIDKNYIQKHIAQQEAIKIRAVEINNFLAGICKDKGVTHYMVCGFRPDVLDIEFNPNSMELSYDYGDCYDYWFIPFELFDYDQEQLIEYAEKNFIKGVYK